MQSDTRSFIVRIWHEALNSDGSIRIWRGSIERVGNGQRLYFCDLEGAVRFIQDQAELRTRQAGPRWRSLLDWIRRGIKKAWETAENLHQPQKSQTQFTAHRTDPESHD